MTPSGAVTRIAVDLGASSGRVIAGRIDRDGIELDEVARFSTQPVSRLGPTGETGLFWDFAQLVGHVGEGLTTALHRHPEAVSVGIDSWAVDFGLLRDGSLIDDPICYRDPRHHRGVERVHGVIAFEDLYERNGLQFLPFTSCYQLCADDPPGRGAEALALIPDLVTHDLTGSLATERSNASTTGLLDPRSGQWDEDLVARLGIPRGLLTEVVAPGDERGEVVLGGRRIPVLTTASHDTAAAVAATPFDPARAAFVSLGTWALAGVELGAPVITDRSRRANFTNEGGVAGTTRFLRNVMGTWLLTETLREWGAGDQLPSLLEAARTLPPPTRPVHVDDPVFLGPGQMATRLESWLRAHDEPVPGSRPEVVRLVLESTAAAIAATLHEAAELSGVAVEQVHVVGGGARNQLLCQLIANHAGLPVLAGPVEATAIGNLLGQAGTTRERVDQGRAAVSAGERLRHHAPTRPDLADLP